MSARREWTIGYIINVDEKQEILASGVICGFCSKTTVVQRELNSLLYVVFEQKPQITYLPAGCESLHSQLVVLGPTLPSLPQLFNSSSH